MCLVALEKDCDVETSCICELFNLTILDCNRQKVITFWSDKTFRAVYLQGHTLCCKMYKEFQDHPHFQLISVALYQCVAKCIQMEGNCDVVLRSIEHNEGAYCPGGIGALGGLSPHWGPHGHGHGHRHTHTHTHTDTDTHTSMQLCYHTHVHCRSTDFILCNKFAGSLVPGIWPP